MSDDAKFFNSLQARLIAIEARLNKLETSTGAKIGVVKVPSLLTTNVTIAAGATYTTANVTTITGVPTNVRGVFITAQAACASGAGILGFAAGDYTFPDPYNNDINFTRLVSALTPAAGSVYVAGQMWVPVSSNGTILVKAYSYQFIALYIWVNGWWI